MSGCRSFTAEEARRVGKRRSESTGNSAPFDVEQFRQGMDVTLEHGLHDPRTTVTDDNPGLTA
jgi:hypothetical protein